MKREMHIGKYQILRTIGAGGFATVYLGQHVYLQTQAALKVLRIGADLTSKELEGFLAEARTIARLHHPHIVSIMDFDVEGGLPYLVMEYAPNGSLLTQYPPQTVLPPKTLLNAVKQVAGALQCAHDHGIVHCDVKPENMLLDRNNKILLSDFGIAVVISNTLNTREAVGTMHYMAPEQFTGKPVPASDQYALAVVTYRWLCGQLPFKGKNALEMYQLHAHTSPQSLREINPQIPHEVEQVVLTALAKEPRRRFSDIRAFATALEQAIQAEQHPLPASQKPSRNSPMRLSANQPEIQRKAEPAGPLMLLPSLSSLLPSADLLAEQFVPSVASPPPYPPSKPAYSLEIYPHRHLASAPASASSPTNAAAPTLPGSHYLTYTHHTSWISAIAWSPDARLLASASWDTTVQIWEAEHGTPLLTYHGHTQPIKSVAWSPDGVYIASGSWDNTVQVWEASTGEALPGKYRHTSQLETVAWSPDGLAIASAGHDGEVRIWQAANRETIITYHGHTGPIWSLSWSPDGHTIASASHDKTVHIWEALTGKCLYIYREHQHAVAAVAWSPDQQQLASSDYAAMIHLWGITTGHTVQQYQNDPGTMKALAWSPDGTRLATAVKQVQLWDTTGTPPVTPTFIYTGHSNWVNALAWSPDGTTIASASDDKTVQLWAVT